MTFQTRFELEKIDLFRVRENGNRVIGQDDVGHPRPSAVAYSRRPTPGRGFGGEVGQERAIAQRLDRLRINLYGRTVQCDLVPSINFRARTLD